MEWRIFKIFKPTIGKIVISIFLVGPILILMFALTSGIDILCNVDYPECSGYIEPLINLNLTLGDYLIISITLSYLISSVVVDLSKRIKK